MNEAKKKRGWAQARVATWSLLVTFFCITTLCWMNGAETRSAWELWLLRSSPIMLILLWFFRPRSDFGRLSWTPSKRPTYKGGGRFTKAYRNWKARRLRKRRSRRTRKGPRWMGTPMQKRYGFNKMDRPD